MGQKAQTLAVSVETGLRFTLHQAFIRADGRYYLPLPKLNRVQRDTIAARLARIGFRVRSGKGLRASLSSAKASLTTRRIVACTRGLATVSSQLAAHLVIRTLNGETVDWNKEYMEQMMQGVNTFRSYVMGWYEGTLDTIFFADRQDLQIKKMICSVLAGYVWDLKNPYVKNHGTALQKLARTIELTELVGKM